MTNLEAVHALIQPINSYVMDQGCDAYPYPSTHEHLDQNADIRCGCDWEEEHAEMWQALKQLADKVDVNPTS